MTVNLQPRTRDRIWLIEHSPIMSICLKEFIESTGPFHVVGESQDGNKALECLSQTHPDIVVINLNMDFTKDLELIQTVHQIYPHIAVVALSWIMDEPLQTKCCNAGAWACLTIPCPSETLHQTLLECVNQIPLFSLSAKGRE